jgi:hypothetical protein
MLLLQIDFVELGIVEYVYVNPKKFPPRYRTPQLYVYSRCLRDFGKYTKFMAFIDADEFIVVADPKKSIPMVVKEYEKYGGLTLNWMFFGSSGHITRPAGGVLENYVQCGKNPHLKSVVATDYTLSASELNPHCFVYKDGYFAVDTNRDRVIGPANPGRCWCIDYCSADVLLMS